MILMMSPSLPVAVAYDRHPQHRSESEEDEPGLDYDVGTSQGARPRGTLPVRNASTAFLRPGWPQMPEAAEVVARSSCTGWSGAPQMTELSA